MDAKSDKPRTARAEPVIWHVVLFCVLALLACIAIGTWLFGDLMVALTLSVTLLAAVAVKAFRAFDD